MLLFVRSTTPTGHTVLYSLFKVYCSLFSSLLPSIRSAKNSNKVTLIPPPHIFFYNMFRNKSHLPHTVLYSFLSVLLPNYSFPIRFF